MYSWTMSTTALVQPSGGTGSGPSGPLPDLPELDAGLHLAVTTEAACARRRLAIMFTDIVDSTTFVVHLGDELWLERLRWHDRVLRAAFRAHGGHEVNQTGDGFFTVFQCPRAALHCAVDIQEQLAAARAQHGFGVHVRIGIQWVDVLETPGNSIGRGVHEAARINEMAATDEILVSRVAFDAAGGSFAGSPLHAVSLRGLPEPLDLVSLYAGPASVPCVSLAQL
jgi:class 3 adenylate cyclase